MTHGKKLKLGRRFLNARKTFRTFGVR